MNEEIILDPYLENTITRKYEVEGTLYNIHGGHSMRTQTISNLVFDVTDEITEKQKTDLEKKMMKRSRPEQVHTFPKNDNGELLIPFGGKHGYMMGVLRVALLDLYKDKLPNRNWEGYGLRTHFEHGIFINPEWISGGNKVSNPLSEPKKYLVETASMKKTMTTVFYDIIKEIPFNITIEMTNAKIPEEIFLEMLAHSQRIGWGPKGRGRVKYHKVVKTIDNSD